MKLLLATWFLLVALASFGMPGYKGDVDGEVLTLVPIYAVVAGLAAISVRRSAPSEADALLSTLPVLGLLVAAPVAGYLRNAQMADYRGEPLFLYFGVLLWASWAVVVLSTALVKRKKWNGIGGIGVSLLVAGLGWLLFTMRID